MKTFDSYLSQKLENPELKKEYDALEPEFSIIQAMIDARKESGLTQNSWRIEPGSRKRISAASKTETPTHPCTRCSAWLPEWE